MAEALGPTNEQIVRLLERVVRKLDELAEGQRAIADELAQVRADTDG